MATDSLFQIVPSARPRDAVGRMALGLQRLARKTGFTSLIFTERQTNWWRGVRRGLLKAEPPWGSVRRRPPRFAIYHHSTGSVAAERFREWPAERRIVLYHNITPPELLAGQSAEHARWGREQLRHLGAEADVVVGLSRYSCSELGKLGARRVAYLPYYLWKTWPTFVRLSPEAKPPVVLIVGRIEPHKRVLEAALAFRVLQARVPAARLVIIGNDTSRPDYVESIRKLGTGIEVLGKISDRALWNWYAKAGALLTLSEHEGFCVPVVEAMRFGVPVVAFNAGATPETLGTGGIVLDTRDPGGVAAALESVLNESALRSRILAAQEKELPRFSAETFERGFRELISSL